MIPLGTVNFREKTMASSSLVQKLVRFLHSPQGQRAVTQARQMANKPGVRQRLATLARRFGGRR